MGCLHNYLMRDISIKKGERGASSKFSDDVMCDIFKYRYFNEEGLFLSYRSLKEFIGKDSSASHECIRQIINNVFESLSKSNHVIKLSQELNKFVLSTPLFSLNQLKSEIEVFKDYELPSNNNAICELLTFINNITDDKNYLFKTIEIDNDNVLFVYTDQELTTLSAVCSIKNKVLKHTSKNGYIRYSNLAIMSCQAHDHCMKKFKPIPRNLRECDIRYVLSNTGYLFYNEEDPFWLAKDISETSIDKKINIISSFYYHMNNKNITYKEMFEQISRNHQERKIPSYILKELIKQSIFYKNNEFFGTMSYNEVFEALSHTEKVIVELLINKDIKEFGFEDIVSLLKEENKFSNISVNSLRVYMTYSYLFKVVQSSNRKDHSQKLIVSII